MALKGGNTYPTDVKYGNTRVDEVKGKKADNTVVTQGTRPAYSFTDANWLGNLTYTLTPGYTDGTHRGAYSSAVAFYGDTLNWGTPTGLAIDYTSRSVNAGSKTLTGDQEFGGTSQDSGNITIGKSHFDEGSRSSASSVEIGGTTAKGTPPDFPGTASYPVTVAANNGVYKCSLWVVAMAQGNSAITGDAYINIPAKAYSTLIKEVVDYEFVGGFSDLAYNDLQPVNYLVPLDTDSYYFITLKDNIYLDNLGYTCSPSRKAIVNNYSITGPAYSYNRPARTISVSTTNDLGYTGVSSFQFTCTRGKISSYLGLSNVNENNSYNGWDDFSFSAHPLDTGTCSLTLKSGWKCSSSTSGSFGVTTASTGSITFNVQPIAYTLTVNKGTGVTSSSVTITRGEAGRAAGATDVSGGKASSYTIYYGDVLQRYSGAAAPGYKVPAGQVTQKTLTGNYTISITTSPYTRTLQVGAGGYTTPYAGNRTIQITRGSIAKAAGADDINQTDTAKFTMSSGTGEIPTAYYTLYNGDSYTINFTPTTASTYWSPEITGSVYLYSTSTTTITKTYYVYAKPTVTLYNSSPSFLYGESTNDKYLCQNNWIKIVVPDAGEDFDLEISYYCETYNFNDSLFLVDEIENSYTVSSGTTTYRGQGLSVDGVANSVVGLNIEATVYISYRSGENGTYTINMSTEKLYAS